MPVIPQSDVLAQETDEKRGEISGKFWADFRPSISRQLEIGRKIFTEKSPRHFSQTVSAPNKVLSLLQLGELRGPSDVKIPKA